MNEIDWLQSLAIGLLFFLNWKIAGRVSSNERENESLRRDVAQRDEEIKKRDSLIQRYMALERKRR